MNKLDILTIVLNDGGASAFASITAETPLELLPKKSGNPYFGQNITKLIKYNVKLNCNYSKSVNAQREREGKDTDFKAKPN